MAVKYATIKRVCTFETSFQQVTLVQNFWNFHTTVETSIINNT